MNITLGTVTKPFPFIGIDFCWLINSKFGVPIIAIAILLQAVWPSDRMMDVVKPDSSGSILMTGINVPKHENYLTAVPHY